MKKLLVILLLGLVAGFMFASSYQVMVASQSGVEVTEHTRAASLGYEVAPELRLASDGNSFHQSFTLYNNFPATALINVNVVNDPDGLELKLPPMPMIIPPHSSLPVEVAYQATDMLPGSRRQYIVTYQVAADIEPSAYAEVEFDVPLTIIGGKGCGCR